MEVKSSDNQNPDSKWKIVQQLILDKKIMREGIQHCDCSENCNENHAPTEDTTSEQKLENKTCLPPAQQKEPTSPTENDEKHPTNDEIIEGSTAEVSAETRSKATESGCTDSEAPSQVTAALPIPKQEETEPRKETKPVVEHDEISGKVSDNLDKLKNVVTQGKQRLNTLSDPVSQRFRRHRDPSSPSRNALPCESEWKTEKEERTDVGSGRDYFPNSFEEHVPENLSPAATTTSASPGQLKVEDPAPEPHKEPDQVDDGLRNSTEKYPCENTDFSRVETCDDAPPDEATSSHNVTEKPDEGEDFQIATPDKSSSSQNCTVNQENEEIIRCSPQNSGEQQMISAARPVLQHPSGRDSKPCSLSNAEEEENEGEDLEASVQELQVTDAGTNQHRTAVENVDETADKEDGVHQRERELDSISSTAVFDQVGAKNGLSPTNRNHQSDQEDAVGNKATSRQKGKKEQAIQSSSARNNKESGLEDERSLTTPTGNDNERELNHNPQPEEAESTTNELYSIDETNQRLSPRNNSEPYPSHETEGSNQDATTRINSRQNLNQDRNQASVYHAINESHASNEIPNSNIEPNQGSAEQSNSEQGLNNETEPGFQIQNYGDSLLNPEIHQDTQGNQNEPPDIGDAGNPESQQEDNNLPAQEPGLNHGPREVYQPTVIIGVRLRQPTSNSGTTRELESFARASAQQTVRSGSVEVVDLRNGQRMHDRQHDAVQRTVAGGLREVLELVRLPRPGPPATNESSMPAQQSENPGDSSLLQLITRFRSQLSPGGHQMCRLCDERPPDTILLNCHHIVFCRDCARLASYCPLPGCDVATLGFIFLH